MKVTGRSVRVARKIRGQGGAKNVSSMRAVTKAVREV